MARPYTQEDMQRMGCNSPGCTEDHSVLCLSPLCHPGARVECHYDKPDGVLYVECAKCERPVASFLVASSGTSDNLLLGPTDGEDPWTPYREVMRYRHLLVLSVCLTVILAAALAHCLLR